MAFCDLNSAGQVPHLARQVRRRLDKGFQLLANIICSWSGYFFGTHQVLALQVVAETYFLLPSLVVLFVGDTRVVTLSVFFVLALVGAIAQEM